MHDSLLSLAIRYLDSICFWSKCQWILNNFRLSLLLFNNFFIFFTTLAQLYHRFIFLRYNDFFKAFMPVFSARVQKLFFLLFLQGYSIFPLIWHKKCMDFQLIPFLEQV